MGFERVFFSLFEPDMAKKNKLFLAKQLKMKLYLIVTVGY